MTAVAEARAAWRALVAAQNPQTKVDKLALVGQLSAEHRAAILAVIAERRPKPVDSSLDDPNTVCYIYVHEE